MTIATRSRFRRATRKRLSYQKVLEQIRALPENEQERLRAELEKTPRVYILRPTGSLAALRRGRRLAAEIRKELAKKQTGTLEATMLRLRGRAWSP